MSVDFFLVSVGAVVLACAGALALTSRLNTPVRGLELLLVAAVVLPFEVGATLNASVLLSGVLCITWILRLINVDRRVALDGSRIVRAALTLMAVASLAFLVGQYPWFPTDPAPMRAQLGGLAVFLMSGGLFLFVGHNVVSLRQLTWLTWLFVGAAAVALVMMVVVRFDFAAGSIAVTNASSVGGMFWVWVVAVTFSQALCNSDLSLPKRFAVLAVGLLALGRSLILAFDWVTGWLPPLVSLAVILLMRFPRFTLGWALLLLTPALIFGGRVSEALISDESYSWATRLEGWRVVWDIILLNPVLGFGPANYYHYTELYPVLGWWVKFNSHNNYIDLVAQTGVLGLVAFGWFVVEVFRLAIRLRPRVSPGFPRAYLVGVIGGLAGSLVAGMLADWIIPFAYNIGLRGFRSSLLFWFFLGGLLSLKRITDAASTPVEQRVTSRSRDLVLAQV